LTVTASFTIVPPMLRDYGHLEASKHRLVYSLVLQMVMFFADFNIM
jgi:hypothetical protein